MKIDKIQDNGKKAIEYFKFKLEFAKNKSTHAMNLNHLITFYNTFEIIKSKRLNSNVMDALILELIRLKLKEYNGDLQEAVKQIGNLISFNPGLSISMLKLDLQDYLYLHYYNQLMTEIDFFKYFEGNKENLIENLIKEALNLLKNEIEWNY